MTLDSDGSAVSSALELGVQFGCPGGTQISVFTFTISVTNGAVSGFVDADNGFWININ